MTHIRLNIAQRGAIVPRGINVVPIPIDQNARPHVVIPSTVNTPGLNPYFVQEHDIRFVIRLARSDPFTKDALGATADAVGIIGGIIDDPIVEPQCFGIFIIPASLLTLCSDLVNARLYRGKIARLGHREYSLETSRIFELQRAITVGSVFVYLDAQFLRARRRDLQLERPTISHRKILTLRGVNN